MAKKHRPKKNSAIKLRLIGVMLFFVLLSLLVSLFGERGILELWALNRSNAQEASNNEILRERNQRLMNEIADLKYGGSVLEELAREDLGMIKPGETFFKVIEKQDTTKDIPQ